MYWAVPMVIAECYDTAIEFMDHPEWWLRDDKGKGMNVDLLFSILSLSLFLSV